MTPTPTPPAKKAAAKKAPAAKKAAPAKTAAAQKPPAAAAPDEATAPPEAPATEDQAPPPAPDPAAPESAPEPGSSDPDDPAPGTPPAEADPDEAEQGDTSGSAEDKDPSNDSGGSWGEEAGYHLEHDDDDGEVELSDEDRAFDVQAARDAALNRLALDPDVEFAHQIDDNPEHGVNEPGEHEAEDAS